MTTITIDNAKFKKTHFIDEKELFLYIVDYLQDKEDKELIENEIKNDDWYRVSLDNYCKNV